MGIEIREQIAKLAYEIYENSGRVAGRDLQNWLTAEKAVLSKPAPGESRSPDKRRRAVPARKKK
jgi:hypothetical protein